MLDARTAPAPTTAGRARAARARRRAARRVAWRVALALWLAAALSGAAAQAPFAALTVEPRGSQVFDILTGVTLLPEGGTVTDQGLGVSLSAERIEYRAQEYVLAWGVSLLGSFGHVTAETLRIDQVGGSLTAAGGLRLERDGLTVEAATLDFDAATEVAAFGGGVRATRPAFSADRVLLDVRSGDVLLEGEYLFEGGLFAMRSPEGGGLLALKLVMIDGVVNYDAGTEVAPELLARFAAYL